MTPFPRWLGIAILLVIAVTFALNHVAARVAFDHGVGIVTGVVIRPGGTALAVLNFEPVAPLFLGWAILGQGLAPRQIAGALIVIGAIVALGSAKR